MKTVGEILSRKRLEKKISIETVAQATKIRVRYLELLEKGEYDKLPNSIFVKGFIKNYARFLDIDADQLISVFRREFEDNKLSGIIPNTGGQSINRKIKITPGFALSVITIICVLLFFGYLLRQFITFSALPPLEVNQPKNNQIIKTEELEIKGKTDFVGILTINGQRVDVNIDGSFQNSVRLVPGLNTISISVTNKAGKTKTIKRIIRLELEK